MRWRREPHSERSSPGSAAFDLECERENLTPYVRTRRGASDHAGARSRVSLPARASIPKAARAEGQKGRRAGGQEGRRAASGEPGQAAVCAQTSKEVCAYIDGD